MAWRASVEEIFRKCARRRGGRTEGRGMARGC